MSDCLFCRMVAGEIPADVVHETDRVLAFRDINPQAPTHVLVIPKEHHRNVGALAAADTGLLGEVVAGAHAVALQEGLVTDDGNEPGYRSSPTPALRPASRCTTCTSTSSAAATWAGRPADGPGTGCEARGVTDTASPSGSSGTATSPSSSWTTRR